MCKSRLSYKLFGKSLSHHISDFLVMGTIVASRGIYSMGTANVNIIVYFMYDKWFKQNYEISTL